MIRASLQRIGLLALAGLAGFGQAKPDFSGTWELSTVVRDGRIFRAGENFKETQIWTHKEPRLAIKMMVWDSNSGYVTLELSFATDGKPGPVGYRLHPDGSKTQVNGSAHWEGDRLVVEHELLNPAKGAVRKIIRTCGLEGNGQKLVADQIYWMEGSERRLDAKWTWEKKSGTP
jgi:hypothetical protein